MRRPFGEYRRTFLATLLAFGGVSLLSVCADVNGPDREHQGHVAFAPALSSAAAAALGSSFTVIDNVRIIIRATDGTIVLDTVVAFPAGADEVAIAADIPVHGDSERFRATIHLRSGSTALFEGTQDLDVQPGQQPGTPTPIPVTYVGTGADAVSLTLAPGDLALLANGAFRLVATVRDEAGNVIQNVPLGWSSSDERIATVSNDGLVSANSVRGVAVITASTLGGIAGTATARVSLPASQLRVAGGSGQTGRVSEALPLPFVVELLAADGVGIGNATVVFGAGAGGSITPTTATTDANGRASAAMTLGNVAGPYTFTASAGSLSIAIDALATVGDPNRIAIAGGDGQSGETGTTLPTQLSVRVTDAFGNPGAGRQVNWAAVNGGSVGSPSTITNGSGIATNTYTLPVTAGAQTISASLSTGGSVQFSATALPRPASVIKVSSGGSQSGAPGAPAQQLVARVSDALDQPVGNVVVTWVVSGSATLAAPSSITNAAGLASIGANFGLTAGPSIVTASITAGASAQFILNTGGTPTTLEIVAGNNQTGAAGSAVPVAPSVRVLDAQRNPLTGVTVTFGGASGGGSVTGGTQVTNGLGIATVGSWILGGLTAPQTMTATVGLLTVTFNATSVVPVSVAFLSVAGGDGQIVNPGQQLQPLVVQASAANESAVPGATIQFTVIAGSATPTTGSAVTDANGNASFITTAGAAGPNKIRACVMPSCTVFTDFTYTTIASGSGSIWTGNVSSSWSTAGNWNPIGVPGSGTNVFIPANATNFVVLTAGVSMNELFMASGSVMNVGAFQAQIGGKVATSGAFIFGSGGSFRLTGTAPITGDLPSLFISGTASAGGSTFVSGNVTIESGGRLDVGAGAMTVSSGFSIDPAGRLTMNNSSGSLEIDGDAFFGGQDMGNTDLNAGLLDVHGNFTASATGTQAFRANGTHTTRLSGFNTQTLFFSSPGAGTSRFQNLEITNASGGGIAMSSNVYVGGTLLQGGRLTVPTSRVFTIVGQLTLQSGSTTTVLGGGSLIFGNCVNQGGTATGFTC